MHRRVNPREARRMMQRMGMNMNEVADVEQVIIKTNSKEITIEEPGVAMLEMQGQKIFQVTGGKITEKTIEHKATVPEARKALEESGGDLAKAILLLQSKF